MTETTTKHKGRKPGSKNKRKYTRRTPAETDLQLVKTAPKTEIEEREVFIPKMPLDLSMGMAYPINNLLRPAIPSAEEVDRAASDMIATITYSAVITKRIISISKRNPAIIQSLERNGIDPGFLEAGYNFSIKDLVVIERVTGERILRG